MYTVYWHANLAGDLETSSHPWHPVPDTLDLRYISHRYFLILNCTSYHQAIAQLHQALVAMAEIAAYETLAPKHPEPRSGGGGELRYAPLKLKVRVRLRGSASFTLNLQRHSGDCL